jgi:hypothetical protein
LAYLFFGKYTEFLGNTPIPRKSLRGESVLKFGWGVCISVFLSELSSFLPACLPACLRSFRVRLPALRMLLTACRYALRY